ncbi:hypothetical protein C3L33_06311, partial [Rhododendron williamsianum]
MNHKVDHPGQELISSSRGEVEEEEEENKDRDGDEGKVGGEEEGMLPPPKRPRNQCLDRISALHDSLILHILSFLPMEDVVRTDRFVTFVNRTLLLCTCSHIKKFVLQFRHHPDIECSPLDTNLWIRFAMQNNVEELYLRFRGFTEVHRLPQHLFTNSTLRILSASNCIIAPGGGISWRLLKSLTLDYAELSDGALAKILLGCPVLEILKIRMFSSARRMDINSASLKMLVVHNCMIEDDEYAVEIAAPNLQVLELRDIRPLRNYYLISATLMDSRIGPLDITPELFSELLHLKTIEIVGFKELQEGFQLPLLQFESEVTTNARRVRCHRNLSDLHRDCCWASQGLLPLPLKRLMGSNPLSCYKILDTNAQYSLILWK